MRITVRCLPEFDGLIPEPVLAEAARPDWLTDMPSTVESEALGRAEVRTLKHCPPMLDAFGTGIVFPLAADVAVENGTLSWDWPAPPRGRARPTRSPIGLHVPEQASGAPFRLPADRFVVKFTNFWAVEAPAGVSLLFLHPLNREDLPFRTLSGLVDCDRFADGFVHFPVLWTDPDFEGVLERGTPVAQAVPVRRERIELIRGVMDDARLDAHVATQDALQADPGHYRKAVRDRASRSRSGGEQG